MIAFECPGCTKPLEANRAFAGFDTRCLRCGTLIRVPSKSGDEAETLARSGMPKPRPSAPQSAPASGLESEPIPSGNSAATSTLESPALPKRRSLKAEVVPEEAADAPAPVVAAKPKWSKKKVVGASIGGFVVVGALAAFGLSGKSEKPAPKRADPPPTVQRKEEPPAPTPPPKNHEPPPALALQVAPLPRALRPAVEGEMTAAAMLLEYGESPQATDLKYDGRDLLIRGVYQQHMLGKVTILPGDERTVPITFSLSPPSEIKGGDLLPDPGLKPGQPVVLRGTYRPGCRFTEATVELTDSPAQRAYAGKSVYLEGAIVRAVIAPTGSAPYPSLVLEPHATDSKISVTCCFKVSDLADVMKLKTGQKVDVRGRCSGRTFSAVRLDNCSLATPENAPGAEVIRLPANAFFTEYEADLLAAPRVNPRDPALELLPVTAEGLGHAYQVDPRSANITYRNKAVQLSGYVKERHAATRMLVLQCGTDTTFSVAAIFSPAAFDALTDEKTLVIRGVCSGLVGGYVRIESAEYAEAAIGSAALRTDVEFLPYRLGKEYIVDQVAPGRGKESQIKRMAIRFNGNEQIHVIVQKSGTIPGNTLFRDPAPEPKWNAYAAKFPPLGRHHRINDGVVEIGQPVVLGDKKEVTEFWEPVLKSGLKRGQSWSAKFPDGRVATYTVVGFTKLGDADQLDIKRVLRSPTDPTRWEETASSYVRGIGEIRRIVTNRNDHNESVVISESRLVSDGSTPASELRTDPKK
jgi:hypothetical protein